MKDIFDQASRYKVQANYLAYGRYNAGKRADKRNKLLGIPVIVATSAVGTSIFATLSNTPSTNWKISTGLLSILATVLAAVQTFFKFSELAEKHKQAGAKYGKLRREIEIFLLRISQSEGMDEKQALSELQRMAEQFGNLAEESPDLANDLYDQAVKAVGGNS